MASLTLERNSDSDALFDDYQANTVRYFRLIINGPQIGSGDLNNLAIDWAGSIQDVIPLANQDRGNNIDTIVTNAIYDTTGTAGPAITVTTETSAI